MIRRYPILGSGIHFYLSKMIHKYTAYDLEISSEIALPELPESKKNRAADLIIRRGKIDLPLPEPFEAWKYFHLDGNTTYLCWRIVGKFAVHSGKEIIIDSFFGVEEKVIRLPLLGAVLATALHQRKLLVLHGNAVAIDLGAAIFIGSKGQGKSTMSAALYGRGHQLVADDVSALQIEAGNGNTPAIVPSFPQIKLWPESIESALNQKAESLRKIHPEVEKRAFPALDNFCSSICLVKKIYVLATGSKLQIVSLQGQEAVAEIIANSYIPMMLEHKFMKDQYRTLHLTQCVKLANSIPIARLERPRSLDLLDDVARSVEEDLLSEDRL